MTGNNANEWGRIVVSGLVVGVIWTLLSVTFLAFLGGDFFAALPENRPKGGGREIFLLASNFGAGIWAMWLYSAIRPRYGPRSTIAAIATGVAWWFIVSLQSGKWVALGFVRPEAVWAPFLATLPSIVIATLGGAWIYEKAARR